LNLKVRSVREGLWLNSSFFDFFGFEASLSLRLSEIIPRIAGSWVFDIWGERWYIKFYRFIKNWYEKDTRTAGLPGRYYFPNGFALTAF
jgi:hypothetical protein